MEEMTIQLLGYSGRQDCIYVKLPTGETELLTETAKKYENADGRPLSMEQFPVEGRVRQIPILSYITVRRKQ